MHPITASALRCDVFFCFLCVPAWFSCFLAQLTDYALVAQVLKTEKELLESRRVLEDELERLAKDQVRIHERLRVLDSRRDLLRRSGIRLTAQGLKTIEEMEAAERAAEAAAASAQSSEQASVPSPPVVTSGSPAVVVASFASGGSFPMPWDWNVDPSLCWSLGDLDSFGETTEQVSGTSRDA